jgi:hypothetical protein
MRLPNKSALPRVTSFEDDQPLSELFPRRGQQARAAGTDVTGFPPSKRARVDDATARPRIQLPPLAAASPPAPKAPAADEASKAPRQPTVGERMSVLWFSGKARRAEFGPVMEAYKSKLKGAKPLSGGKFLVMILELTKDKEVKRFATGHSLIQGYSVQVAGTKAEVHVLRRNESNGFPADIRRLSEVTLEALHELTTEMGSSATNSRSTSAQRRGAQKLNPRIHRLWIGARKKEFAELHKACKNATDPMLSGLRFFDMVYRLTNEPGARLGETSVPGIERFGITIPGAGPIQVLRRLDEKKNPADLRLLPSDELEGYVLDRMGTSITFSSAQKTAAARKTEKSTGKTEAKLEAGKKPRPQATKLKHALEMKQVLELMLENRNSKRPLLDGVEAKTKLSGSSLRSWFEPDGSLSGKRTHRSFMRLNGYFELTQDLHVLFNKLGQSEIAGGLPQPMSADQVAQALRALFNNPAIVTAAPLANIVKANAKVVEKTIDARTGSLLISNTALLQKRDYAAHRSAIEAALKALGHRPKLPEPETPAETFMRDLEGSLRRVEAAADAMRRERLPSAQAAQREGVSPELVDMVVGPGGAVRDAQEIADRLPGFKAKQRPELDELIAQLRSQAPSAMSRVHIRRIKKTAAKLFIVGSGHAASGTREAKTLAKVFAHSPELVRSARSFKAERPRQALRWLSTVLRSRFENAVEITSYHDRQRGEIWVSSNKREVNEKIQAFLSGAGLKKRLAKPAKLDHASRHGRHEAKLRTMLADPSARPDAREVLEVMSEGRFRVPVESFHHDGHELDYHAQRRIKAAFTRETGEALDLAAIGGTMRPCGTCADVLGFPDEARRGPFWQSRSARAFTDMDAVVDRNIARSIGSYVTKMKDAQLSVHYDTESDSEVDAPGRLAKRVPAPHLAAAALSFGLSPAWGGHRPRGSTVAPVRSAAAATAPHAPAAAWPIAQGERDFIAAYLRQDVPDPQQAMQMLRELVLAQVSDFNDVSWHREEAYSSVDAVLAQISADTGADIARAIRLAQELGDAQLSTSVHAITLGRRADELQGLQSHAVEAHLLLSRLGVAVSEELPVGMAATQQVLEQLIDEGSHRFAHFMRRLDAQHDLKPSPAERSELAQIGRQAAALRRSAALLGWLPAQASPTQPLPQDRGPPGVVWSVAQTEALFARGNASGVGNNCWFDAVAQLSLNRPRAGGDDARIEQLAQRVRRASDRLGFSGTGEMFDDANGQMHVIARAMGVQVHAFNQLPDGALRLSPLESVGAPQSRPVYIRSDDVHFEPMWPTWQAAPTGPVPVKAEPAGAAAPARAPLYVETALDQARTAFHRDLGQICDLTGEQAEWRTHFDRDDMAIVRHDMQPMPENDHKFPLRDPADALGRVHPRYADEHGNVHPRVRLNKMQVGTGFRSYFRELVKSKDARLRVDPGSLPKLMTKLEEDAARQLQRLISGQVEPPRCTPRVLLDSDVQPHERMLVGQHGLFVTRPEEAADRPTLSNGRILGFYMGALVENDHELAHTVSLHPDYERYAIDAHPRNNRPVMYSALGATNSIAFANTALKPDSAEPAVDRQRVNALFIELDASLTDNKGRPRIERLVAMVALDNLFDGNQADAQVLADYGDNFLENFKKDQPAVKEEPASP